MKKLRDEVCKKLAIKPRQLRNRISEAATKAGIIDRDIALLLLAHDKGIDVTKPRFEVLKSKLAKFETQLRQGKATGVPIHSSPVAVKKSAKTAETQVRRLLKFKGKYPDIFYDRLEDEINTAYSNPALPNAVLMLSRKLIENLVYNLLQYKLSGHGIKLYFDTKHNRPLDFGVLLDNLKVQKGQFDQDQHDMIDKFLSLAKPFKRDANSKVHNVLEYLESMKQIKTLKIPEMAQILLKLIELVRKP
ncbi:MAG TPA: hypothetical protein VJZ75_09585 [Candidatus Bathyarchaeia archaeon]|nr:hypothetical protein [Candidatus Bathyarchaeia archaeon]